jgi:uncharacterized membrane protein
MLRRIITIISATAIATLSIYGIAASIRDAEIFPIVLFIVMDVMMIFLVWIEFRPRRDV